MELKLVFVLHMDNIMKSILILDDNKVEITKWYLKGVDSYIEEAFFINSGIKLTDEELDYLQCKYPDWYTSE